MFPSLFLSLEILDSRRSPVPVGDSSPTERVVIGGNSSPPTDSTEGGVIGDDDEDDKVSLAETVDDGAAGALHGEGCTLRDGLVISSRLTP